MKEITTYKEYIDEINLLMGKGFKLKKSINNIDKYREITGGYSSLTISPSTYGLFIYEKDGVIEYKIDETKLVEYDQFNPY